MYEVDEDQWEVALEGPDGFEATADPAWARRFPASVRDAIAMGGGAWPLAVQRAVNAGIRDADLLADLAFWMHVPHLGGRSIPMDDARTKEWVSLWKFLRKSVQNILRAAPRAATCLVPDVSVPFPKFGIGIRRSGSKPTSTGYGLPETILALQTIGLKWARKHPGGPDIQVSDISKKCGGRFPPHGSHRFGIDVDIRFIRTDGAMRAVDYRNAKFDLKRTQDLVDIVKSNGVLKPHRIWIHKRAGIKGIHGDTSHRNHMHVRFCLPKRYSLSAMIRKTFPGGTKGSYSSCA
jgi:hypothetical protein